MCGAHWLAFLLVFVGALNWGLVGVAMLATDGSNWNVVNLILGGVPTAEAIVYILVGVAALFMLLKGKCAACKK